MTTTDRVFTVSDVLNELRNAVYSYPMDWVDPNAADPDSACLNVYTDKKGVTRRCIAAQVLSQLGVSDEELQTCNREGIYGTLIKIGWRPRFTDSAAQVLNAAQLLQDKGTRWSAIATALSQLPLVTP